MFVYYKSKILFVLYDNCDDTYSFNLFLRVLLTTLFFFYKNLFYKNVEAEIDPNFKNVSASNRQKI